jgi:hypothetical protein
VITENMEDALNESANLASIGYHEIPVFMAANHAANMLIQ